MSDQNAASIPELNEFQIHNDKVDIKNLPIFTRVQLAQYNGVNSKQMYVAIRGFVYDVTQNDKSYGPGKAYHSLVGKDVSRLLGLNRLKPKDDDKMPSWFTDDLDQKQNDIIDKWVLFFKKRYYIVGMVVDHN